MLARGCLTQQRPCRCGQQANVPLSYAQRASVAYRRGSAHAHDAALVVVLAACGARCPGLRARALRRLGLHAQLPQGADQSISQRLRASRGSRWSRRLRPNPWLPPSAMVSWPTCSSRHTLHSLHGIVGTSRVTCVPQSMRTHTAMPCAHQLVHGRVADHMQAARQRQHGRCLRAVPAALRLRRPCHRKVPACMDTEHFCRRRSSAWQEGGGTHL